MMLITALEGCFKNKKYRMAKANLSFIREAREELKKVSWPSRQTTIRYTIIVIAMSLGVGLITGGIDWVLSTLLKTFILS